MLYNSCSNFVAVKFVLCQRFVRLLDVKKRHNYFIWRPANPVLARCLSSYLAANPIRDDAFRVMEGLTQSYCLHLKRISHFKTCGPLKNVLPSLISPFQKPLFWGVGGGGRREGAFNISPGLNCGNS